MRISTRPAEGLGEASRREETYSCRYGTGRIVTIDGVPFELTLPATAGSGPPGATASPGRWVRLLESYFAGAGVDFDLDLDAYATLAGLTDFEREVYAALVNVPRGTVVSYRELATVAGHPRAYRAVGSVMARNRLPVILPCHRVVRNDGALGLYGDDPSWKPRLLVLEGVKVRGGRLG
jgi:methylated-DNA-[protein]-cysteine S-methyltransferase